MAPWGTCRPGKPFRRVEGGLHLWELSSQWSRPHPLTRIVRTPLGFSSPQKCQLWWPPTLLSRDSLTGVWRRGWGGCTPGAGKGAGGHPGFITRSSWKLRHWTTQSGGLPGAAAGAVSKGSRAAGPWSSGQCTWGSAGPTVVPQSFSAITSALQAECQPPGGTASWTGSSLRQPPRPPCHLLALHRRGAPCSCPGPRTPLPWSLPGLCSEQFSQIFPQSGGGPRLGIRSPRWACSCGCRRRGAGQGAVRPGASGGCLLGGASAYGWGSGSDRHRDASPASESLGQRVLGGAGGAISPRMQQPPWGSLCGHTVFFYYYLNLFIYLFLNK